jgi:hypothetical protein
MLYLVVFRTTNRQLRARQELLDFIQFLFRQPNKPIDYLEVRYDGFPTIPIPTSIRWPAIFGTDMGLSLLDVYHIRNVYIYTGHNFYKTKQVCPFASKQAIFLAVKGLLFPFMNWRRGFTYEDFCASMLLLGIKPLRKRQKYSKRKFTFWFQVYKSRVMAAAMKDFMMLDEASLRHHNLFTRRPPVGVSWGQTNL